MMETTGPSTHPRPARPADHPAAGEHRTRPPLATDDIATGECEPLRGAGGRSVGRDVGRGGGPGGGWKVLALVGAVVAGVMLAGCTGSKAPAPGPSVSVRPSPTGLAAGVWHLGFASYRFKVVAKEGSYAGAIDPVADLLDASVSVSSGGASLTIDTVEVRGNAYTRLTGLPLPGFDGQLWYSVDTAKVTRPGSLGLSAIKDPTGVQALIAAAHDVRRDGRKYAGTVDMTRVAAWGPVNVAQVMQLGAAAKAVPFEATVDDQDRLATVTVSIPDNPVTATYSDFGAPVTADEPKGAQPLPDHLYGMLGL
ncbi:LppX_LprAFG lipoprotein [Dactylosporangium matsuzakiense]|uniref:LppX_LprAFG lipoprotein n=1 Tax=Dactylosporangium matsuzakiense TaxID=53360 RepID=UPI0022F30C16|nr:LppX_LprAFG lipoprotein [Dactylosporangium matsuzakiense]